MVTQFEKSHVPKTKQTHPQSFYKNIIKMVSTTQKALLPMLQNIAK